MRDFIGQMTLVLGAAVIFAAGHRGVQGPLADPLACEPAEMKDGYVCYATVADLDGLIWVDARARKDFEKGHLEGAQLLNTDPKEDFETLFQEAFPQLALAETIVIYCGQSGCRASAEVADLLKAKDLDIPVQILFGGVQTLRREKLLP